MNDIQIHFDKSNIGIDKIPQHKIDINGDIKSNKIFLPHSNLYNDSNKYFYINNNDNSNLMLSRNSSYINTNKLGINNNNPNYTLDINGELKINSLYGNYKILDDNQDDININYDKKYKNTNIYNNLSIINSGNINIGNNQDNNETSSLSIENYILDSNNNKLINMNDTTFNFNPENNKNVSFNGKVLFNDNNNGVVIGNINSDVSGGELRVSNKITTKRLDTDNINVGTSNISNPNNELLLGNNLYNNNNNIRVKNDSENGYRGINFSNINGVQFYTTNKKTLQDDIPNEPNMTLSNTGQLIYTIPILEYQNVDMTDLNNEIYNYTKNEISNKKIGSFMTFTTQELLNKDTIINCLKNNYDSTKLFFIDLKTNNVVNSYDVSL